MNEPPQKNGSQEPESSKIPWPVNYGIINSMYIGVLVILITDCLVNHSKPSKWIGLDLWSMDEKIHNPKGKGEEKACTHKHTYMHGGNLVWDCERLIMWLPQISYCTHVCMYMHRGMKGSTTQMLREYQPLFRYLLKNQLFRQILILWKFKLLISG